MYTNLKLKVGGSWYAILGATGNGGYRVTPLEGVEGEDVQHGLMPRPWLAYKPNSVLVVNEGEVEEFLAYSV